MIRILKAYVWVLLVSFICLLLAYSYDANPYSAMCLIGGLVIFSVGFFVYRQNPTLPLNSSFLWLSVISTAFSLVVYLLHIAIHTGLESLEIWIRVLRVGNLFLPPAVMAFTLNFIEKKGRRWSILVILSLISILPFLIFNSMGIYITEYKRMAYTYVPDKNRLLYALCGINTMFWVTLSAGMVLLSCISTQSRTRRSQYIAFLVGWAFPVISGFLGFLPAFKVEWFPSFISISLIIFPIVVGFSIMRFGLFDIKFVIRRTIPYAIAISAIACTYALALILTKEIFDVILQPSESINVGVFFIVTALLFQPALEESRAVIDRLFFRRELAMEKMLAEAAVAYNMVESPEELAQLIHTNIQRMMEPEGIAVFIEEHGNLWHCGTTLDDQLKNKFTLKGISWQEMRFDGQDEPLVTEGIETWLIKWNASVAIASSPNNEKCFVACRKKKSGLVYTGRDMQYIRALCIQAESALERISARRDAFLARQITLATFESIGSQIALIDSSNMIRDCNSEFKINHNLNIGDKAPNSFMSALNSEQVIFETDIDERHFLVCHKSIEHGEVKNWQLVTMTDITEITQLKAEYQRKEALVKLGVAVSSINHEIQNILSPVAFFLDKAATHDNLELRLESIDSVRNRLKMLDTLTKELRDYYREPELSLSRISLKSIVTSSLIDLQVIFGDEWIAPQTENIECDLYADPQKLKQLVFNILKNAWQAMDGLNNKSWKIKATEMDNKVIIDIIDSGRGIPDRILPHLFSPFVRAKSGDSSGLGLAICQRLADAHNANIEAFNRDVGGAVFRISWPACSVATSEQIAEG